MLVAWNSYILTIGVSFIFFVGILSSYKSFFIWLNVRITFLKDFNDLLLMLSNPYNVPGSQIAQSGPKMSFSVCLMIYSLNDPYINKYAEEDLP